MDGTQYACVSKNLAEGRGSFWFPFLSPFWCQNGSFHFFEHPPLFYFLESLFFRIPGMAGYAEKVFCLVLCICNALSIHMIWKLIQEQNAGLRAFSWLPILLWIITPVCFWCFQNNMVEIVLSLFTLLSTYCTLRFLLHTKKRYVLLVLSGAFLYGAFLTKGLVGLFPLGVCLIFSLSHKSISIKQALIYTGIVLTIFLTIFFVMCFFNPSAQYTLTFYLKERLLSRIDQTPTTNNRFELLFDLISQLLPIFIICGLAYIIQKARKQLPVKKGANQWFWFFLILGCSGSLPIMLTMVQKGFYFMPSLAFFALAFSVLILRFFKSYTLHVATGVYRILLYGSLICLIASVGFCVVMTGKYSRDKTVLMEVDELGHLFKNEQVINADMGVYTMWNYQLYLQRYYGIYIDPTKTYRKYIIVKTERDTYRLSRYQLLKELDTGFKLYVRK